MNRIFLVCTFPVFLFVITASLGGCTIGTVGFVTKIVQSELRSARERAIIGRAQDARQQLVDLASDLLAFALGDIAAKDWENDQRLEFVRKYLQHETDEIVKYANSLPIDKLADVPVTEKIPTVDVVILLSLEPDVVARGGGRPSIKFTLGYLLNLVLDADLIGHATPLSPGRPSCGEENSLIDAAACSMFQHMSQHIDRMMFAQFQRTATIEFQEAVLFSVAHEVTHIWMDRRGESRIEQERRADAYGILLNLGVSPATKRKVELDAEFRRRMTLKISDPLDTAVYVARYGPDVALKVYRDYCFEQRCYSEGDFARVSIGQRIQSASKYAGEIVDGLISDRSESDILRDRLLRYTKDVVLGFVPPASNLLD